MQGSNTLDKQFSAAASDPGLKPEQQRQANNKISDTRVQGFVKPIWIND